VRELRPGLWTWQARHPDWTPDQTSWGPEVTSYAYDAGEEIVLFDPLTPPDEVVAGRRLTVVLTGAWHARDAGELGVDVSSPGEPLPAGVEERPAFSEGERIVWIPEHRALVLGDILPGDASGGVHIPAEWVVAGATLAQEQEALRPLLDLPVELLLPTHGEPVVTDAKSALARALT
jgi:hypothetical protein